MSYQVIKRYDYSEIGPVAFRQHKAKSHCRFIHGYALAFEFTFECEELDTANWCLDFGGLKDLKGWLKKMFDHRTYVSVDDPNYAWFLEGQTLGVFDLVIVTDVSCEKFAEMVFIEANEQLKRSDDATRVQLISVKVSEHGGNHAVYFG